MVCENVISMWCVVSMRCNQSLCASWHGIKEALDIFLGNVPPRILYSSPQSITSRCWRTLMNKSPTNHIPDMFDGQDVWRTCRPWKQWYPSSLQRLAQSLPRVAGHCPAEMWHVELPEGGAVPRAGKTSLISTTSIIDNDIHTSMRLNLLLQSRARVRKSGAFCHCSVTYLLPILSPATSVWRLIYVFWAQRSTDRRADSTRCTQTSVYSRRVKYIVRHWTSREASLRHSIGWGTEAFPLSSVICAPVV